jgi:hypothetical protein
MSTLGCYLDSCSHPHSDSTRNPTLAVLSICLSEILVRLPAILYSHILTSLRAPCLSALQVLGTPLGHPCLNSSYKSEPAPSDPIRPSSSALQSKPLPSNSAWRSAQASTWTSVSHSVLRLGTCTFNDSQGHLCNVSKSWRSSQLEYFSMESLRRACK